MRISEASYDDFECAPLRAHSYPQRLDERGFTLKEFLRLRGEVDLLRKRLYELEAKSSSWLSSREAAETTSRPRGAAQSSCSPPPNTESAL